MLKCVLWLTTEKGICFGQINISVGIDKCINSADLNQQVGSFPFVSAEGTLLIQTTIHELNVISHTIA